MCVESNFTSELNTEPNLHSPIVNNLYLSNFDFLKTLQCNCSVTEIHVCCLSASKLPNPVYSSADLVRYPKNMVLCTFQKAVEPSGGHKGDNSRVN